MLSRSEPRYFAPCGGDTVVARAPRGATLPPGGVLASDASVVVLPNGTPPPLPFRASIADVFGRSEPCRSCVVVARGTMPASAALDAGRVTARPSGCGCAWSSLCRSYGEWCVAAPEPPTPPLLMPALWTSSPRVGSKLDDDRVEVRYGFVRAAVGVPAVQDDSRDNADDATASPPLRREPPGTPLPLVDPRPAPTEAPLREPREGGGWWYAPLLTLGKPDGRDVCGQPTQKQTVREINACRAGSAGLRTKD
jgi:hypothetical protein